MSHYVLIQEPRREGIYVQCRDVDQCLRVVDDELNTNLPGTRVTMFRKQPRETAELLAMWRVERGGARRYRVNADTDAMWEALADRATFVSGRMYEIDSQLSAEGANWNHNTAHAWRRLGKHGTSARAPRMRQHYAALLDQGHFSLEDAEPYLDEIESIDPLLRDEIEDVHRMMYAWREAER